MPNFGLVEITIIVVLIGLFELAVELLPWVIAQLIKSVKKHL